MSPPRLSLRLLQRLLSQLNFLQLTHLSRCLAQAVHFRGDFEEGGAEREEDGLVEGGAGVEVGFAVAQFEGAGGGEDFGIVVGATLCWWWSVCMKEIQRGERVYGWEGLTIERMTSWLGPTTWVPLLLLMSALTVRLHTWALVRRCASMKYSPIFSFASGEFSSASFWTLCQCLAPLSEKKNSRTSAAYMCYQHRFLKSLQ